MIKQAKRQLYSSAFPPIFFLLLGLGGFFFYSIYFQPLFFIPLSFGLLVIVVFLISMRGHLIRKLAEYDLNKQDLIEKMNILRGNMDNDQKVIQAFRRKIVNYSAIKGLTERLSMALSLEETSKILSTEVNRLFGRKEITTILYHFQEKTGELGISSSKKGQMQVNIKSKKGDIFDEWVVKTLQPLLVENTKTDYRFDIDKIVSEETRSIQSLISLPLMIGNRALGILRVDSPRAYYFSTEDLRFLMTIGDLGAVAIENAQLYERVEELAIRDSLTGLYLRRYLLSRLGEEISRHLRSDKPMSFLMIDLDYFKKYNDRFGHTAGDIVLKTISDILSEVFNAPGNLVCRYGGEEFSVLLTDCPKKEAFELAEQVRRKVKNTEIILRRKRTHITISVGIASFSKDAKIKEELIQKADDALYRAKNSGRDRVCSA